MRSLILVILVVAYLPFLSVACNYTDTSYGLVYPSYSCGNVGDNITAATRIFQAGAALEFPCEECGAFFELPCEANSTSLYYTFTVDWGDGTVPDFVAKNMSLGEEIAIYHHYKQLGQYSPSYSTNVYENATAASADDWIIKVTSSAMSDKISVTADNCEASIDTSSAPHQVVDGFYILATILSALVMLS